MAESVETEFVRAVGIRELPPGRAKAMLLNGTKIAVFNVDGVFHAIDDTCTHAGGPLSEGAVEGGQVTCPWHGAVFDITKGKVLGPPARREVKSYEVRVDGDDVLIKV